MMIRRCRQSCQIQFKSCAGALQWSQSPSSEHPRRSNPDVQQKRPIKSISNGQSLILPTFHQKRIIRHWVQSDCQGKYSTYQHIVLGKRKHSSQTQQQDIDVQFDFFSEPITFLSSPNCDLPQGQHSPTNEASVEALDTFIINVLTRGKSSKDGGNAEGVMAKAAHSTGIVWADIIRHLASNCRLVTDGGLRTEGEMSQDQRIKLICDAPMMAAVAFSPLLAQTGPAYLVHLSNTISTSNSKFKADLYKIAKAAASQRNNKDLSYREQMHLTALSHLLESNPHAALNALLILLETSPGDLFAYALALDLSQLVCQPHQAERATMSISAYWNERSNESFSMQSSYVLASSLLSYGLACSGGYATHELAEHAAEAAKIKGGLGNLGGGNCAAALSGVYSAEGRVSEGTSILSRDGIEHWESCGFLFWNVKLMGKGGHFVLSNDRAGRNSSALRMYDGGFGWVLESAGYVDESANTHPMTKEVEGEKTNTNFDETMLIRKVPKNRSDKLMKAAGESATSMWSSLFVAGKNEEDGERIEGKKVSMDESIVTLEDILTWLPPTTTVLTEATFLLFRLTLSGAITGHDERWSHLRAGWERTIDMEKMAIGTTPLIYSSLARIAFSLVLNAPEGYDDDDRKRRVSFKLEKAARIMGNVLDLGSSKVINNKNEELENSLEYKKKTEWKEVVQLLTTARSGWSSSYQTDTDVSTFQLLMDLNVATMNTNEDLHQFFGNALYHAALETKDYDALHSARAVCSATVTVRSNTPEGWRMYAKILEALGDANASQDAMNAAISLGSGEGGRPGSM